MRILTFNKYIAYSFIMLVYCIIINTALAAPCVLDESSADFLIPAECSLDNIPGLEFSNLRFMKVDNNPGVNLTNDPGNVVRFGAANYTFALFTPVFDTRADGCQLTFDAREIEQNDELAIFTAPNAVDSRVITIAWILDCEIVQDR